MSCQVGDAKMAFREDSHLNLPEQPLVRPRYLSLLLPHTWAAVPARCPSQPGKPSFTEQMADKEAAHRCSHL